MKSKKETSNFSRRDFIKTTAVGVSATALAGLGAKEARAAQLPTRWDQVVDVVVVGYGGAGAVTAITAFDAGASVLILEKAPAVAGRAYQGGGNTCMNAGNAVYPKDPTQAAIYLYANSWGATPMAVCQAWAQRGSENPAWLDKMGIKYTLSTGGAEFPNLPGAAGMGGMTLGSGPAFFQSLDGLVKSRGIPVLPNTQATDLIQDPATKEILGILAQSNGTEIAIKANKAVVLCTGSFEFSDELKLTFLRCYPAHFYGWEFCTGDGLKMALKAGAGVWHTEAISARMVPWFPEYAIAYSTTAPSQHGWIYVDKYGNRYADETQLSTYSHNWWLKLSDFDLKNTEYTRIPSFLIFDETCRKAGPVTSAGNASSFPPELGYHPAWSSDNSAEIARGWIQQGSTLGDLAAAISKHTYVGHIDPTTNQPVPIPVTIDPAVLSTTVANYNSYCAGKQDTQFGRSASTLVPIQTPPFYALALWPGGPSAYGGPIRNEKAQVCDPDSNPIPRLYSAGELGSVNGLLSLGANNAELIIFGRIAGENAAAETSW